MDRLWDSRGMEGLGLLGDNGLTSGVHMVKEGADLFLTGCNMLLIATVMHNSWCTWWCIRG